MGFVLSYVLTFSILLGGVLAILRFGQIRKEFYPFIYLVWLACINELLGFFMVLDGHFNIINNNVYSICESFLLLWFFKKMGRFRRLKSFFLSLFFLFALAWIADNFVIHHFG